MKPTYFSVFLNYLGVSLRGCFFLGVFCLTGFLGNFNPLAAGKSYTVMRLAPGIRAMQWPLRKAELQKLSKFNLQGYIEVRSHHNKGINLAFRWEQGLDGYCLKLLDTKDQVLLEMNADQTKAYLKSQDKVYSAKNAELLLEKHLGVKIPLRYFKDWLRGIPSPNIKNERVFNPTKHLLTLNQGGWFIRYLRYHEVRKIDLPTQLFMMQKDWYVRVLVTHWKL